MNQLVRTEGRSDAGASDGGKKARTLMGFKAGIVGAAGFAGAELVRILLRHPDFEIECVTSDALAGTRVADAYPAFEGVCDLAFQSNDDADLAACDVAFLAVPHTASLSITPSLLAAGVTVIDLSADYRLRNPETYELWYATPHTSPELLERTAFGLPELFGDQLAAAAHAVASGTPALVACAGCYPTATSLAAAPALLADVANPRGVVVADAVSGVTGAGKKATERTHFCFANENAEAYGVATHRHTPEIEQILGIEGRLVFTPHLVPMNRGLLSTVTIPLATGVELTSEDARTLYADFYRDAAFVRVLHSGMPKTSSVSGTNFAHVGVAVVEPAHALVAVCAIDNLGKGAAGQAVQCANIVFGLDERRGIEQPACAV